MSSDGGSCVLFCTYGEFGIDDGWSTRSCISCAAQGLLLSSDGASCVSQCNAGEARDGYEIGGGLGFHSLFNIMGLGVGHTCINCRQYGAFISSDGGYCVWGCSDGDVVTDDGWTRACFACSSVQLLSSDGTSCLWGCNGGEIVLGNKCGTCRSLNMLVSAEDGTSCVSSCNAGEARDGQDYGGGYGYSNLYGYGYGYGNTCINCRQHGAYVSSDGGSCVWNCNGDEIATDDGWSERTCVACYLQGLLLSSNGAACVMQCNADELVSGNKCAPCYSQGLVLSADGASCEAPQPCAVGEA
jgi:hypothetical protein